MMSSTTTRLYDALINADSIDTYLDDNAASLEACIVLGDYLKEKQALNGLSCAELFSRSDINPSYGYQLLNGTRVPSRDTAIQLAFGLSLSLDETQRMLRLAKVGALYPRDRRDSVIIFCIKEGYTLSETNTELNAHGFALLKK